MFVCLKYFPKCFQNMNNHRHIQIPLQDHFQSLQRPCCPTSNPGGLVEDPERKKDTRAQVPTKN